MRLQYALCKAVIEALATLGQQTAYQLMSRLCQKGIIFTAGDIDFKFLNEKLKEMFGSGSDSLMQVIYERFNEKLEANERVSLPCDMRPSERILAILARVPASQLCT